MKRHILRNLKKVLATVLAVAMVVTCLPEAAFSAKAEEGVGSEEYSGAAASTELQTYNASVSDPSMPYFFGYDYSDWLMNEIFEATDNDRSYTVEGVGCHSSGMDVYLATTNIYTIKTNYKTCIYLRVPRGAVLAGVSVSSDTDRWIQSAAISDTVGPVDFTTEYEIDGEVETQEYTCYMIDMCVNTLSHGRTDTLTVTMDGTDYEFTFHDVRQVYKKGNEDWTFCYEHYNTVPISAGDKFRVGVELDGAMLTAGTDGPQIIGYLQPVDPDKFEVSGFYPDETDASAAWSEISDSLYNGAAYDTLGNSWEFIPVFTYGNDGNGKTAYVYYPELTAKSGKDISDYVTFYLGETIEQTVANVPHKYSTLRDIRLKQDGGEDYLISFWDAEDSFQNTLIPTASSTSNPRFYFYRGDEKITTTDSKEYTLSNGVFSRYGGAYISVSVILGIERTDPAHMDQLYVEADFAQSSSIPADVWEKSFNGNLRLDLNRTGEWSEFFSINLTYTPSEPEVLVFGAGEWYDFGDMMEDGDFWSDWMREHENEAYWDSALNEGDGGLKLSYYGSALQYWLDRNGNYGVAGGDHKLYITPFQLREEGNEDILPVYIRILADKDHVQGYKAVGNSCISSVLRCEPLGSEAVKGSLYNYYRVVFTLNDNFGDPGKACKFTVNSDSAENSEYTVQELISRYQISEDGKNWNSPWLECYEGGTASDRIYVTPGQYIRFDVRGIDFTQDLKGRVVFYYYDDVKDCYPTALGYLDMDDNGQYSFVNKSIFEDPTIDEDAEEALTEYVLPYKDEYYGYNGNYHIFSYNGGKQWYPVFQVKEEGYLEAYVNFLLPSGGYRSQWFYIYSTVNEEVNIRQDGGYEDLENITSKLSWNTEEEARLNWSNYGREIKKDVLRFYPYVGDTRVNASQYYAADMMYYFDSEGNVTGSGHLQTGEDNAGKFYLEVPEDLYVSNEYYRIRLEFTLKSRTDPEYSKDFCFLLVHRRAITDAMVIAQIPEEYPYSENIPVPAVVVKDGNNTLVKDMDYSITYNGSDKIGNARIIIKGLGRYTGEVNKTYKIYGTLTYAYAKGVEKTPDQKDLPELPESAKFYGEGLSALAKVESPEGYRFAWYSDADATTEVTRVPAGASANITYYGKWVEASYSIKYMDGDSRISGLSPSSYAFGVGTTLAKTAVKPDHIFMGWFANKELTGDAVTTIAAAETGDKTFYAKFVLDEEAVKEFNVTFNVDGGSAVATQSIRNNKVPRKPTDPKKDGFKFEGWFADEALTTAFDFEKVITADTTVYAKWSEIPKEPEVPQIKTFTVTFSMNGGSAVAAQTVEEGKTATKPATDPTREGYRFGGWYADAAFNKTFDFAAVIAADTTVYAKWYARGMSVDRIADQVYTGSAIKPEVRVYDGDMQLREKTDYTLSFKNNTKVGVATVTITGKGAYTGTATENFNIVPIPFNDDDFTVSIPWYTYTGSSITPKATVRYGSKVLKEGTDYTVAAGNFVNEGTYTATVEGKGNYSGTLRGSFGIAGVNITLMSDRKITVAPIKSIAYTGNEITPEVTVKNGKKTELKEGEDYTLSYRDNTDAGKATVIITGAGEEYAGVREVQFTITGTAISSGKVDGAVKMTYTGDPVVQADYTVRVKGTELREEQDYTVSYLGNVNVGKATMVFTGRGGYTGTLKKAFSIEAYDIKTNATGDFTVEMDASYPYEKGGVKPEPVVTFGGETLREKLDYTLSYKNNTKAGGTGTVTITGKGNFKGKYTQEFAIEKQDIDEVTAVAADVKWAGGKGKFISKPVLMDANGKKLSAGTDYKVKYYITENGGEVEKTSKDKIARPDADLTVTVKITGNGQYDGETSVTYLVKAGTTKKLKSISAKAKEYEGVPVTLTADDFKTTMTLGTDFEIVEGSYSNNGKKGTASVIIRGIGDYVGQKTLKFTIKARKVK